MAMTRVEAALAECDRRIKECEGFSVVPPAALSLPGERLATLHIGRDVLTRHGINDCSRNPCPEAQPWLDLLAPEPTP